MKNLVDIDYENIVPISRISTEAFKTGTWSNRRPEHVEKVSACRKACPAGNNISKALFMGSKGDFNAALDAFLEENPLPGVCGRVCYHPCETDCNRADWDGAVGIQAIERAVSEKGEATPKVLSDEGKAHPVAVVGSGPAGLSAAYHLARMGHPVSLIESEDELGGMLRWAIPTYRLPKDVLDGDVNRILSLDIQVNTGTHVDQVLFSKLMSTHKALFLALGAQQTKTLDLPGINLKEVYLGLDFLKDVRLGKMTNLSGKITVLGGGNVAIDTALTALRLGADHVELICLEQLEEMPAREKERQDALEEGIVFKNGWGPKEIFDQNNRVSAIELVKCVSVYDEKGRFNPKYDDSILRKHETNHVILAIGQAPDFSLFESDDRSEASEKHFPHNGQTMETSVDGVFAGGDFVEWPGTVVDAIAAGKKAALAIHLYTQKSEFDDVEKNLLLGGGPPFSIEAFFNQNTRLNLTKIVTFEDLEPLFMDDKPPLDITRLEPIDRSQDFSEIIKSFNIEEAKQEASRCFSCGICTGCDRCFLFCPDLCIMPSEETDLIYQADSDYCKGCSVCAHVCPRGVMTMSEGK